MAIKAKIGAGVWDMLFCENCGYHWAGMDIDLTWTDDPEPGGIHCPRCESDKVVREERG
jgi:ribosomal protein L37AE/L43A